MSEPVHTAERLAELQALPLDRKIQISQARIIEWYQKHNGNVFVSFSGGKDSTVLLHLVRQIYADVLAVFSNTGLEFPEIQKAVKDTPNVDIIRPKMSFIDVVTKYGYPIISKDVSKEIKDARLNGYRARQKFFDDSPLVQKYNKQYSCSRWLPVAQLPIRISHLCCNAMKKKPIDSYYKKGMFPFVGILADESRLRKLSWIKNGCNAFDGKRPSSRPLSFWTDQDILRYIVDTDMEIPSVYGDIVAVDEDGEMYDPKCVMCEKCTLRTTKEKQTGCIFCAFGLHLEKGETKFQRIAKSHPRQYEYALGGGQWIDNPTYDNTIPEYDGEWKNWNPKQIWVPSKQGLGMKKVFDMVNEIYGKDFYRYE